MASQIPAYSDSLEWITAYLTAHSLSIPSWRYSFLLWLTVSFIIVVYTLLRCTGFAAGSFGAVYRKWSLRRRTWRKKHTLALAHGTNQAHRQPASLPSNAQLLSATILILVSLTLVFAGPDYLAPSLNVWQIQARSASPPYRLYDTSTFTEFMPQYTIAKSLWSSSARTGQIAFALFPLCVLFALKAPPFAIFAIPFAIELHFDKLAWLHRCAGRLIWFLTFVHVTLWSIQLAKDVNPSTGRIAYDYAWSYTPFIYGWIAFALLTLIVILSLKPIRRRFYEQFYLLHIVLVPAMLVIAGFHHPTVAAWCWAALLLWFGERFWRAIWWIYANGIVGGPASPDFKNRAQDAPEMYGVHRSSIDSAFLYPPTDVRAPSPLHGRYLSEDSPITADLDTPTSKAQVQPSLSRSVAQPLLRPSPPPRTPSYVPPVGYVHAELLSGRTVRLRLITPGFLPWSPGQHFLLNIPSVSWFTSHPFTCASVCDEEAPTDAGRTMLFLLRAKGGWTQDLWELVSRLTAERSRGVPLAFPSDCLPKNGVLLRAYVDGPFGSIKRTRWGGYSTGIIVTGGSGVSFGLSLLQYMCMCMAGRDGRHLGGRSIGWRSRGTEFRRVRFIWLIREYSHIQWCASILRRCMSIVSPSALQVDIYVTNFTPVPMIRPPTLVSAHVHFDASTGSDDGPEPPRPSFFRDNPVHPHSESTDSEGHESFESDVDLSCYLGEAFDNEPPADEIHNAHEANILDLTNFDGEVDMALPEEAYLSQKVKKEGKLRRLQSRQLFAKSRVDQDGRLLHPLSHGEVLAPPLPSSRDVRQANSRDASPSRPYRALSRKLKTSSAYSTDGLLAVAPPSERPLSLSTEVDLYSPLGCRSPSPLSPYTALNQMSPPSEVTSPYPANGHPDVKLEPGTSPAGELSHVGGALGSQLLFGMDEQEATDVNVVSEHARPGKPRLDKVIADEVNASKGPIVVACCGPASLNVMVRKIVATQIDPGRIRRGDMRGSITLVSEDYEY